MRATSSHGPLRRRWVLAVTVGLLVVFAAWGTSNAADDQSLRHVDHVAYAATLDRMDDGEGYYDAYVAAYQEQGIRLGRARAFRQPLLFVAQEWVPDDHRLTLFFVGPVLVTSVLVAQLSPFAPAALLSAMWIARTGVLFGVDAWLLAELWAVPFIAGACVARSRDRPTPAAALAGVAVLIREVSVLFLLGLVVDAAIRRRGLRPFVLVLALVTLAYAVHLGIASDHALPNGNDAELVGTGSFAAIADMTGFLMFGDTRLGLVVWVLGLAAIVRLRLYALLPLAMLPFAGLVVGRPYWGWLFMPILAGIIPAVVPRPTSSA